MSKKVCSVDGCDIKHYSKGYCKRHYDKMRNHGDPLYVASKPDHPDLCSIDGCNNIYKAKGFCNKHYRRLLNTGTVELIKREKKEKPRCKVEDCENQSIARGYCQRHYVHKKKSKELFIPGNICSIDGCENVVEAKRFCPMHYARFKKYGDPLYTISGRGMEKHGMNGTTEYNTWSSMRQRCHNDKSTFYYRYGGRGITVCDRWKNSFIAFLEDMGKKPFPEAQLDRIDNDLGYCKENCEWVTREINMRHTSRSKLTIEDVRKIRHEYSLGGISHIKLGMKYGVSGTNIKNIINGSVWKES